jgi:transposase InsO family protein
MIKELRANYSVRLLCQVLEVARSGYHRWSRGPARKRAVANEPLVKQIKIIYQAKRGHYGSPRITQELRQRGQNCNHKRVERLMRQEGLKGSTAKKRKVRTTDSEHDQPIAPNLLLNRAAPRKIDEVWVADITYVPTNQGWLYLAAVMDLYSRLILGWSLWESLQATGALQALSQALAQRGYPRRVIHHSDQGLQYACREYRQRLQRYGFLASMSRPGNCYDNAAMEAFWSTLKREALEQSANWSKEQVRRVIFEYIESIYNRSRLHSSLNYQSPVDFEHQKN